MILGLCDRFKCLPSQLLAEDARLMRWLQIEGLARRDDPMEGGDLG